VHFFDAGIHGIERAAHFRDHAARDYALVDQRFGFRSAERAQALAGGGLYAFDIGHQDELGGVECAGNGTGSGVGVDVERAAVCIDADGSDDWNEAAGDQLLHDARFDMADLTDAAEVDEHRFATRVRLRDWRELFGAHEAIVLARQTDGPTPVLTDESDDFLIYRAAQHHFDHIHGLVVGHAQAGAKYRVNTDAFQHAVDLRTAPVNHDHADPDVAQQADIAREALLERRVDHGMASILDDEGALVEAPDVGQGFVEYTRFVDEFVHRRGTLALPGAKSGSESRAPPRLARAAPGSHLFEDGGVNCRGSGSHVWLAGDMDILLVCAECGPYVRETAAADATGALGKALCQLGHRVTLAAPRHQGFEAGGLLVARRLIPLVLASGKEVNVLDGQLASGVALVLFDLPGLFDRLGVYGEQGVDYPDNAARFAAFAHAVAALVRQRADQNQPFEVVHAHDAAAALVPLALGDARAPCVLTIHDVTRQGAVASGEPATLGFPDTRSLELGGGLNVLASGIRLAGAVTTVSARYAEELRNPALSGELASVIAEKSEPVIGIVNGVDYATCNPATDTALESRFDAEDASNKGRAKVSALGKFELELEVDRPLLVAVDGLADSVGGDILCDALPELLKHDIALVVTGRGTPEEVARFEALQAEYRGDYALVVAPDEQTQRRLYAAADIAIIMARHEPCGTRQLFAQRYGAVPVAVAIGGLTDTIVDADSELETGTGFLFDELSAEALVGAVERALSAYASAGFMRLRRRIMRLDVAWDRPARRYMQVYRKLVHGA
jgi:starch synthase